MITTKQKELLDTVGDDGYKEIHEDYVLYILNDNINMFSHVIEVLIQVLQFNEIHAEQCTLTSHVNGKCAVKSGNLSAMIDLSDRIESLGINVQIKKETMC